MHHLLKLLVKNKKRKFSNVANFMSKNVISTRKYISSTHTKIGAKQTETNHVMLCWLQVMARLYTPP